MIIGSATRYIGGRRAIQTVYWRASKKDEKLVKTGKDLRLTSREGANAGNKYSNQMSSCKGGNSGVIFN